MGALFAKVLERLSGYKLLIEGVLLAAALLFVAYQFHRFCSGLVQDGRNAQLAEDKKALDDALAQKAAWEAMWRAQQEKAEKDRADRDKEIAAAGAGAAAAADRVRGAADQIRTSLAGLSPDALRDTATALRVVATECTGRAERLGKRLGEVAADAEKLNAEKALVTGSWPQKPANMQPVPQPPNGDTHGNDPH